MAKPTVAQILLGEAVGEGPEGMAMVADTMLNRSRAQKTTLEHVALAPHQFSAATRPDLAQFYARQPQMLRDLADILVQERQAPDFQPSHPYQHYVTKLLWDNRSGLPATHWIHRMKVMKQVGHHVLLSENKNP